MDNKLSLLEYIKQNIDDNDIFTANTLPDDPEFAPPFYLGTADSYYYTGIVEDQPADHLLHALTQYLNLPNQENLTFLEKTIKEKPLVEFHSDFLSKFNYEPHEEALFELAENFFYHTSDRNIFKFAFLLFYFTGLTKIRDHYPVLWDDILSAARCEEFTYFFIIAANNDIAELQDELWDLAYCTKNWGRIFALGEVAIENNDQRLWCIEHAMDNDVSFPMLSIKILSECDLLGILQDQYINPQLLKGTSLLLINFTELLTQLKREEIEENYNLSMLNLPLLLEKYLAHAKSSFTEPEQMIHILLLSQNLRTLAENEEFTYLSANQYQKFIALCDKIAYFKDWSKDIHEKLFNQDGSINYTVLEFATRIEADVWEETFVYYSEHYQESQLFTFLLQDDSSQRIRQLLAEIEKHIAYYLVDPLKLTAPMLYLRENPGQGLNIIDAALLSKSDYALIMVTSVLSSWPLQFITKAIYENLKEARKYTSVDNITQVIDNLLYHYQLYNAGVYPVLESKKDALN